MASYWSVERDGSRVVAVCPEVLLPFGAERPAWMAHCIGAIRDELRLLPIEADSLLEAALGGEPPLGAALEDALLVDGCVPPAQLHAGARLLRLPAEGAGVLLRYTRVPLAPAAPEAAGEVVAAFRVPITDGHELESAESVRLAVIAALGGVFPPEASAYASLSLSVHFLTGAARTHGSAELVGRLLAGLRTVAGGDRFRVAEVTVARSRELRLEIELRAPVVD